ncbi:phosphotransferase family protein [Embleya sp. NPDC050154]|uniref:phosphotransferase family protein n=1 Tax=unclassified Embleya TaxID=2699296 RepID=UPI00378C264C
MPVPMPNAETLVWVRELVGDVPIEPMGEGANRLYGVGDLVLRVFHNAERLTADPWYRPEQEARVLRLLADTPVPAPELIAARLEGPAPALLTTRVPGAPEPPADPAVLLRHAAELLATIHAVDPGDAGSAEYAPYYDPAVDGARTVPTWTTRPHVWRRMLDALAEEPPYAATGFIHRDFHAQQLLWVGERIGGVVDWTTGCVGPRGIDLARIRLNLALSHGVAVAEEFLPAYAEASGRTDDHHPYWDLLDAGDALLDWPEPKTREELVEWQRFEAWVGRAVRTLPRG